MEKEIVIEKAFDLFMAIASLKANKRTKTPSVNIKQEEAMELLALVNDIANACGKKISLYNEGGEMLVKMEEV